MTAAQPRRVCIYCGSRAGEDRAYAEAAHELAGSVAARGIGVVYGGGRVGLMGVVADAALGAGAEVIGVIPRLLADREMAHPGLTELRVVDSMHVRKQQMTDLSDAFVILPGGIGTLDELIEAFTWTQLLIHDKPIAILNTAGYYDRLLGFLDHAVDEGFLSAGQRARLVVEVRPEALIAAVCAAFLSNSSSEITTDLALQWLDWAAPGSQPDPASKTFHMEDHLSSQRKAARTALFCVLAISLLTLAACGSSSSGNSASDADARDTARLKLQKCLRDNGVNLPAPGQGQGQGFRNIDRQKLQQAMQGPCKSLRSKAFGNITPQQRQAFQDAFVKFAACMRTNGVDVPTPSFNGAGPGAGGGGQRPRFDRSSPKVQAALKKCQGSLPNGGRFGGRGPGGGGPGIGLQGGPPPSQ